MKRRIVSLLVVLALVLSLVPQVWAIESVQTCDTAFEVAPIIVNQNNDNNTTLDGVEVIPTRDVLSPLSVSEGDISHYTVLLLNVEPGYAMSVNGEIIYEVSTPIDTVKAAATKFVERIGEIDGNHYVAIISFSNKSVIETGFTSDTGTLKSSIESLAIGDGRPDINSAFRKAESLLKEVSSQTAIGNIVLFTQSAPSEGEYSSSGHYSYDDCDWRNLQTGIYKYQYANVAYDTAQRLMKKYNIYSIGLFQNYVDVPEDGKSLVDFTMRFCEDVQNSGYQSVYDVDDLEFVFGDVADSIVGEYFEIGRDNNSFLHKGMVFSLTNRERYLNLLKNNNPSWIQEYYINSDLNNPHPMGYCHGLAVSMCLGTQGDIDFALLPSRHSNDVAGCYSDLLAPYEMVGSSDSLNTSFKDLLIYYQLTQRTAQGEASEAISNWGILNGFGHLESFLAKLINEAKRSEIEKKPFVFTYFYYRYDSNGELDKEDNKGGHSVVVCGYDWDEDTNSHVIQIYDENSSGSDGSKAKYSYLTIPKDMKSFSYCDANSENHRKKGYPIYMLEDTWTELRYYGIDTIYNEIEVADIVTTSLPANTPDESVVFIDANSTFTITNADGEYLYHSGTDFSGNMDVYDISLYGSENELLYRITTQYSDTFTVSEMSDGCEVIMTINDKDYAVSCNGAETITIGTGGVIVEGVDVNYNISMAPSLETTDIIKLQGSCYGSTTFRYQNDKQTVYIDSNDKMSGIVITQYCDTIPCTIYVPDSENCEITENSDNRLKIIADGAEVYNPFVDVIEGRYYYDPVMWAVSNNITTGITSTTFVPDGNCTRGQVVTFLWRLYGCPEPESSVNPFVDVAENRFYYKAALWAAEKGITTGVDAAHFAPDATCTRSQVVTFLWRAAGKPAASSTSHGFTDLKQTAFYYDAVLWAVESGITNGITTTTFEPNTTCNRGQVVTFLYRFAK